MAIDTEELRDALLAVLARPQPKLPGKPGTPHTGDLRTVDFDWDVLRFMVNVRLTKELAGTRGRGFSALSRQIGVADTALGQFLRGDPAVPSVRTMVRLMVWLGYTDFAEFLVD